jgi:CheY-like chemotaxis protein
MGGTIDFVPPGALSGVRVLIVDDTEILRETLQTILDMEGAISSAATGGLHAIEILRKCPTAFDVVLMDIQMPVLDGYAATGMIRADLGLARLPIIALSGGALADQRLQATEAGMNGFVAKPFAVTDLIRAICEQVGEKICATGEDTPAGPMELPDPSLDVAHRLQAHDPQLHRRLLRRMFDEFPHLARFAAPVDAATLGKHLPALHKLKGTAGALGEMQIYEWARSAEESCARRDIGQATSDLAELAAAFAAAEGIFEATATLEPDGPLHLRGETPVEIERRIELVAKLRARNPLAADDFRSLSRALSDTIGSEVTSVVGNHIANLQFKLAAERLEQAVEDAKSIALPAT